MIKAGMQGIYAKALPRASGGSPEWLFGGETAKQCETAQRLSEKIMRGKAGRQRGGGGGAKPDRRQATAGEAARYYNHTGPPLTLSGDSASHRCGRRLDKVQTGFSKEGASEIGQVSTPYRSTSIAGQQDRDVRDL